MVTRTADGLRLKHDHRHEDGSEDAVTQYGGDTLSAGTPRVQDFPVDAYSIAMFEREGLDVSLTNVWRVEVSPADAPGAMFAYQLTRRNDPTRLFRVEFDAGEEVDAPPSGLGVVRVTAVTRMRQTGAPRRDRQQDCHSREPAPPAEEALRVLCGRDAAP